MSADFASVIAGMFRGESPPIVSAVDTFMRDGVKALHGRRSAKRAALGITAVDHLLALSVLRIVGPHFKDVQETMDCEQSDTFDVACSLTARAAGLPLDRGGLDRAIGRIANLAEEKSGVDGVRALFEASHWIAPDLNPPYDAVGPLAALDRFMPHVLGFMVSTETLIRNYGAHLARGIDWNARPAA